MTDKKVSKESVSPNRLASKPSGKETSEIINPAVKEPPVIMEDVAAFALVWPKNKPATTGTNNPETINA